MEKIQLKDSNTNQPVAPITSFDAVLNTEGKTLEQIILTIPSTPTDKVVTYNGT